MSNEEQVTPRLYHGVMVSSTFKDLEKHRASLMDALRKEELFAIGMEEYVPTPEDDVISSSLNMVRKGSAYIGLVSHRCGQVIECADRNPFKYSVTRLEFEEAQRLNLPTLIFVMSEDHEVKPRDVETDSELKAKLSEFRNAAKAGRIYIQFNSLVDFTSQAIHAAAQLRRHIEERAHSNEPRDKRSQAINPLPKAPALYAEPPYIGSHKFTGRKAQLDVLNDWAAPADSHPILLFDAIGGSGKSMLTWEWVANHAEKCRNDWAGRFWYSFYEKGGVMSDFCQRALAYITEKPLDEFRKKKMPELAELLVHHLRDKPWLLVLDGLERMLVHYHRIDAGQIADEATNQPTDQIAQRDPCAAIRPEDDDLLRALAVVNPSKLLFTTRLVPRVLLNQASQPIPGVLRVSLPGLRPADAETLIRSCGVTGDSQQIQDFLKRHCDCHPLVTGILAGLINNFLPSRGNFDAWVEDESGGRQLNLANLDIVQKRNHILQAALNALPKKSRELLSTLALVSERVDYPMLKAFNPHLPTEPEEVRNPMNPEDFPWWNEVPEDEKKRAREWYLRAIEKRKAYEQAMEMWRISPELHTAQDALPKTTEDLERRGLLQYDESAKLYDLHPVVRGVAVGGLKQAETDLYGKRVVDYFSRQTHKPYPQAETIEDLKIGLHIVRTLLKMGRLKEAYFIYSGELAQALKFNLEADAECLALMRPFFPNGWSSAPADFPPRAQSYLANEAAIALRAMGQRSEALEAFGVALLTDVREGDWENVRTDLCNISFAVRGWAATKRFQDLAIEVARLTSDGPGLFVARLDLYETLIDLGRWKDAEALWELIGPAGRDWPRHIYRPGTAERAHAKLKFYRGQLTEEQLTSAEQLARDGKNRGALRMIVALRGEWLLDQLQWERAAEALSEAVRMAREIGDTDPRAETQFAIAKHKLSQTENSKHIAEQLGQAKSVSNRALAELWAAIGDSERAKKYAFAAYKAAWNDGEPFVHRYELERTSGILNQLGAEIPRFPPFDPSKEKALPWEDEVVASIQRLKRRKNRPMQKSRTAKKSEK